MTKVVKLRYPDVETAPHYGITSVISFPWRRRDRGRPWIIVERGGGIDSHQRHYWTDTGALVGSGMRRASAERRAVSLRRQAARRGVSARYDVVLRSAVRVCESMAHYGCLTGEYTA